MRTPIHFFICASLLLLGARINLGAQKTMITSPSEKGKLYGGTLFWGDSEEYSFTTLEKELVRIRFLCFLAFTDSDKEGITDTRLLQIGTSTSKFTYEAHHKADSAILAKHSYWAGGEYLRRLSPVFVYENYYTNLTERKSTYTNRLFQADYLYEDRLPIIDWNILQDSARVICGHECQKATGEFRGRTYDVWFTESIPSPAGPWKLCGLPGAILYAEDADHRCKFEAISVMEGIGDIWMADYPYFKVSRKEYADLLDMLIHKPEAFIQMQSSVISGMKVIVTGPDEHPRREICILEKDS